MARYDTPTAPAGTLTMRSITLFFTLLLSFPAFADSYRQVIITEHGGPEVLRLIESAPLPKPGPGQVRVRVIAASASFTDIMLRKGMYPVDAELPYAPGYDLVGVVDALGEGVTGLQAGQRVADLTVWGAYSEYTLHPAENLVPVPNGLPSDEAVVLILSYMTAYQMLFREADLKPQQSVLIHGASGAVGTALAQLGRVAGLKMYGTASTAKQDYLRELGVTPIDYKTEDFVTRIMNDTDGAGVDAVFDAISVDNFERSYSVLAPDGVLVKYGLYLASRDENSSLGMAWEFIRLLWQQQMWDWFPQDGRRVSFYSIADFRVAHPDWFKDDLSSLFELALEKNVRPQIWKTLPLSAAADAHRHIEAGEVRGKIVLQVAPEPD
ncbi:MAG: medium chain dehydrogenase/reductase family protein [Halieaceae bacterium]